MSFFPFSSTNSNRSASTIAQQNKVQQSHSQVLETLFQNFDFDLEQVSDTIDPILTAQSRCEITSLYIQGIVSNGTAFLCTNINTQHAINVTSRNSSWLIGQSPQCAIAVPHNEISLCHAAISYQPGRGFFIADVGSNSGTWVNRRLLAPHQRRFLQDGDLIELGCLQIEFFLESFGASRSSKEDETQC
ncbi:MAG TPA: FHA domain-containing protein [Leptolyngbyaceae cyanobacterium]